MSWAEDAWTELRGYAREAAREKAENEGDGKIDADYLANYMDELRQRYQRGGLTNTEWLNRMFGSSGD